MTRKLVLQMQVSLDGYVSADNPSLDWQVWDWGERWPWDDALRRDFNATFDTVDCILLSRKMAEEGYLAHWKSAAIRGARRPEWEFARRVVGVQKVVASRTLQASRWDRTTIARGEVAREIAALKKRAGGDIIAFGGVGLASSLVEARLVDELQFFVNPTAVGSGRSIFRDVRDGFRSRLLQSRAYACGIVVNRYAPALRRDTCRGYLSRPPQDG
jgi:dihydrofolate reductase